MKIFAAFLAALVLTFTAPPATARKVVTGKTTTEFIKTSCALTPYPELCSTSLAHQEKEIGKSQELLAHAALNVALDVARPLSDMVADVAHNKTLPPEASINMNACIEEVKNSIHKLKMSLVEMKQLKCPGFDEKISYIQDLVAAAITDDDRCSNGLNVTGLKEPVVKEQIAIVAHLALNALTLLNKFAAAGYGGRKNAEFIKTSCDATPYPNICYAELSTFACDIAADPKLLAEGAISYNLQSTQATVYRMVKIAGKIGLSPRQNMSIHVCEDLLHKSIGYIQDSMKYMETITKQNGIDLKSVIDNITEWVKAVKNNNEWCIAELEREKINQKVTEAVTELLREVEPISVIASALFERYAVTLLTKT